MFIVMKHTCLVQRELKTKPSIAPLKDYLIVDKLRTSWEQFLSKMIVSSFSQTGHFSES